MTDFTVAIRTYNRADWLAKILERLRSQINTESIQWDVVVVDNNSTDHTAQVIKDYQADWPDTYPLRYFLETRQGASFARKRAIQEAQGNLIGFLDDDNLPALDWVSAAYTFSQAHPKAGAFGGQIHGAFEVEPPKNFKRIAHFLPVIERDQAICFNSYKYSRKRVLPPGAGLVIRRQAWLDSVPDHLILQGPVGDSLACKGEDLEALLHMWKAGWEIWFNPNMHIYHQIPKSRFEREYLLRFFRGIGLGRCYTRMLGYEQWKTPLIIPLYMMNDLYKIIMHYAKHRQALLTDVVLASEMELFVSSFISPFYTCKQYLLNRGKRRS
jgi:glycosyltransferase involved in cell wall biosynthesis